MVQSAPPLIIAISIYLLVSTCLSVVLNIQPAAAGRNDRPIVGVFAQEVFNESDPFQVPALSYIAASYVKFVEGAGARVVPILVNKDETYLREIFNGVNGLLIPGGSVIFEYDNGTVANSTTKGFIRSALFLLNLAKKANDDGDYFPVWGTCMGFEFLLWAEGSGQEVRISCEANNQLDKLRFQKDAMRSQLFGSAPKPIMKSLAHKPVTINFHWECVTPENFVQFGLNNSYKLLATSFDPVANLTYVAAVEGINYPFFAVQYHPEKNIYEWTTREKLPHSREAVETAQYLAMFFVDQARRNNHSFNTVEDEQANLIYNFNITNTEGWSGSTYNQKYFFPF